MTTENTEFKHEMEPRFVRKPVSLLSINELTVSSVTPEYKVKLSKKGRIKVKLGKAMVSVMIKVTVDNNTEPKIRAGENWTSKGFAYRCIEAGTTEAILINCSCLAGTFTMPDIFLFIGHIVGEGGQP